MVANGLGPRLRELRLNGGLSQRELAEPQYTRAYLSMIEAGRAVPAPEALQYFAGKLRLPQTLMDTLGQARRDLCAGRVTNARTAYQGARTLAQMFALDELAAQAECGHGETYLHIGQFTAAAEIFAATEGSLAVARRVTCLALSGDPVRAIALCERELATHGPDARLYAAIVMPYNHIGAYAQMTRATQHALALLPTVQDDDLLAYLYRAVTHAFIEQQQFAEALDYGHRALDLFGRLELPSEQGLCHLALANALQEADRLTDAVSELDSAVALLSGAGATAYQARAVAVLANVHLRLGNKKRALEVARSVTAADPWSDGYLHRTIGLAAGSEADLRRSIELFAAQNASHDVLVSSQALGQLLTSNGQLSEAIDVYDRGLKLSRRAATGQPS